MLSAFFFFRVFVSTFLDMRCADFPFVAGHCVEQLKQVADSNAFRGCVLLCVRCSGSLIIRALRCKCCQIQIYSVEMFDCVDILKTLRSED